MLRKKAFAIVGTAVLGLGIAACGGDDTNNNNNNTNNTNNTGFQQPEGTTPISFCIDDTANKTYEDGDGLKWKGSFAYDETTRKITFDGSWGGPFPLVYDDGPWNMGGHEPAGATAGDNIWCVTVFLDTPAEDTSFEYGAENDAGWIWVGANGTFTVPAGSDTEVIADPLAIAAHGTIDMRLTVDTSTLADGWTFASGDSITVKGSYAAWQEIDMFDDGTKGDVTSGDGIYTFVLSENVGAGTNLKHAGLLNTGDVAQFVFVIKGVEYKGEVTGLTGSVPLTQGVLAETSADGTTWTEAQIQRQPDGDQNTYITP